MKINISEGQRAVHLDQDKDAQRVYAFDLRDQIGLKSAVTAAVWTGAPEIVVDTNTFSGSTITARFAGGVPNQWFAVTCAWTTDLGEAGQLVVRIFISEDAETAADLGSALFPNKFTAIAQLRRDGLLLAAQNHFGGANLSDEYLWGKLVAAEAELSRTLKVKFAPTMFFPYLPTQEEIDALAGMPWEEEAAYDYDPEMFQNEMWGFINTNARPVIEVKSLKYVYPAPMQLGYEIPLEWIRLDKKYGQVRIVPSTVASIPISGYLLQVMGGNRVIPHMMQLKYVAGLANAARDWPDLVDVLKKMSVLKILEDSFLPQSGSISADGLSQSISVDTGKYEDMIDSKINGPKGSNGGLMAAIHGIRLGVM